MSVHAVFMAAAGRYPAEIVLTVHGALRSFALADVPAIVYALELAWREAQEPGDLRSIEDHRRADEIARAEEGCRS